MQGRAPCLLLSALIFVSWSTGAALGELQESYEFNSLNCRHSQTLTELVPSFRQYSFEAFDEIPQRYNSPCNMEVNTEPTLSAAFYRRTCIRLLVYLRVGYMDSEIKTAIGCVNGLCNTLWCMCINGCVYLAERETLCQNF